MIERIFAPIGRPFTNFYKYLEGFGVFIIFHLHLFPKYFTLPFRIREIFKQINIIGSSSFWVIALTATFTGMVLAVQFYHGFKQFGAEGFMGYTIFIAITRELGPVFAALMLTSRAISAMAAELGTMRVTEQIDAIDTLGVDSKKYLIVPRVIATTLSLPILVIIFDFIGNVSAYMVSIYVLDVNSVIYENMVRRYLEFSDIFVSIIKAFVFGFFIALIGTFVGYNTSGGARGVGISTTKAVVFSSVTIFGANYFLTALFLAFDI